MYHIGDLSSKQSTDSLMEEQMEHDTILVVPITIQKMQQDKTSRNRKTTSLL